MTTLSRSIVLLATVPLAALGCESSLPSAGSPDGANAFLVVRHPNDMNDSERQIQARLEAAGLDLEIVDDDAFGLPPECDLIVISKTSQSDDLGDRFKPATCGIVFWEDNQQMLGMLSTIDNDGSAGTAWHSTRDEVVVESGAPDDLRAGLSGTVRFYQEEAEITWAPDGDLPSTAIVVAYLGEPTNGRTAIYAFEAGALLADGTPAAGRRLYFGLYDDTFRLLTPEGLALFDAAVAWASR